MVNCGILWICLPDPALKGVKHEGRTKSRDEKADHWNREEESDRRADKPNRTAARTAQPVGFRRCHAPHGDEFKVFAAKQVPVNGVEQDNIRRRDEQQQ